MPAPAFDRTAATDTGDGFLKGPPYPVPAKINGPSDAPPNPPIPPPPPYQPAPAIQTRPPTPGYAPPGGLTPTRMGVGNLTGMSDEVPVPSCVLIGNQLKNLALLTLDGRTWEYQRHRKGKVVLLDFLVEQLSALPEGHSAPERLARGFSPAGAGSDWHRL